MKVNVNTGGPFFILFVVFMILKLTNYIAWSWWLVTMPLWILPAIGLTLFILSMVCAAVYYLIK